MYQVGDKVKIKSQYKESYMAKEEYTILEYSNVIDAFSLRGLKSNQIYVIPTPSLHMYETDVMYNRKLKINKICTKLEIK